MHKKDTAGPAAWANPSYQLDRSEVIRREADGCVHEAAWLKFTDWMHRDCVVYAERIVPEIARCPGIVHCVGGSQMIHREDMLFWAEQGYACASFDWQIGEIGQREPTRKSAWPPEVLVQHAKHLSLDQCVLPLALQAAQATLSWLGDHPNVDVEHLGMCGISWGGYLTWVAAAYDKRIKAICPVYGCGVFGESSFRPYAPEVSGYWKAHWDPLLLADKQTAPIAYLSGTNDFFGLLPDADNLRQQLSVDFRWSLLPNADHSIGPGESRLAQRWMAKYLKGEGEIPKTPRLSATCELVPDRSMPIKSTERWWRNGKATARFACWNNESLDPTANLIFGKVVYDDGLSLCTPLMPLEAESAKAAVPSRQASLPSGVGWRWELGSTQLHSNEVKLRSLEGGKRVHIVPSPQSEDAPVALFLHHINDARWELKPSDALRFQWEQATKPARLFAILLTHRPDEGPEYEVPCPEVEGHYEIGLPTGWSWENVLDIRLHCEGVRQPFTFGPLEPFSRI